MSNDDIVLHANHTHSFFDRISHIILFASGCDSRRLHIAAIGDSASNAKCSLVPPVSDSDSSNDLYHDLHARDETRHRRVDPQ